MQIEDCCCKLKNDDYIELVKRRLPPETLNREIGIIGRTLENRNYVEVCFYFKFVKDPPEVFYTHIYITELLKHIDENERLEGCPCWEER